MEYRGLQHDLLGREGIAIAGHDGTEDAPRWNVLILDPDTGDLLGEYSEELDPDTGQRRITTYTARETLVFNTSE